MLKNTLLVTAAAVAALSIAACSKHDDKPNGPSTDSSTQTPNAGPGANVASAVDKTQDAASAAVGAVAASVPTNAQGFVDAAAMGDMYEIKAAQMAETRSTSPAVKKFAAMMIKDHGKTTAAMQAYLAKNTALKAPTDLDQRRTGLLDNLKSAQDKDFDRTYLDQQVAAHEEMLTLMKGFADHGDNADLQAMASKTAPTVQEHLDKAKALQAGADQGAKDNKQAMKDAKAAG
jgi:putative membrane protein